VKLSRFLTRPTDPLEIDDSDTVASLLSKMGSTGFQGRNLSTAAKVWHEMLAENVFIFLGLAGAMVPAGMRRLLTFLIERRYIDCVVSTGANPFHDIHESLGFQHYVGNPQADDVELKKEHVDRIHDVFASEKEFLETDRFIHAFTRTLSQSRAYSTREYFYLLGEHLAEEGEEGGVLSTAAKAGIPVYCPAVGDSSIGIAIGAFPETRSFLFDVIKDVHELAEIVVAAEATGVVYVGGGTPKNFVQQAQVTAEVMGTKLGGHKYGVQVIVDAPHWGGLSGCTFDEAKSWGKVAEDARKVTVYSDATIALPLLATALAQMQGEAGVRDSAPRLDISGRDLQIVQ
jgi:deoxyhypusine synthase